MTDVDAGAIGEDFRQAMRRLASTVALVTAEHDGERTGIAATAVMSVTADPPTLMVAVNRSTSLAPVLIGASQFCVNLLSCRHRDLVGAFSGQKKGAERFTVGNWRLSDDHPPILEDAAASLVCRTILNLELGTHRLFAGEVLSIVNHPTIDPLIWMNGGFATVSA